jgi:hypothetical protein
VIYQLLTDDGPELADTVVAVRLRGARILGGLGPAGSKLRCPLELLDCHVDANLELAMAEAPAISLAGSHLSGGFLGRQLTVIQVGADMLLTGARCSGSEALNAADIGGTLDFTRAELGGSGDDSVALSAENLTVGKNMFTRRVRSSGWFNVFGAHVSGQLTCTGGVFSNPGGEAFNGEQLVVGSYMFLRRVDGLTYTGAPRSGASEKQRDAWLDVLRNHTPEYAAQPYQHLAATFRSQGHDGDVRAILMRQRRDQVERGALTHRTDRFWARLTGTLLGYGYQPWRALLCLVGLLAISVILTASLAAQNALTHPVQQQQASGARLTADGPLPRCSTIEVISAGLDLGTPFLPDTSTASSSCQIAGNSTGAALAISRWVLQLGAWALAALFVAGFTGIVRKT